MLIQNLLCTHSITGSEHSIQTSGRRGEKIQEEGRDLDDSNVYIYIFTPRLFNKSAEKKNINEEASIFLYITGKGSSTKNTLNIIGFTVLIFEVSAINDARAQQRTNKSFLQR